MQTSPNPVVRRNRPIQQILAANRHLWDVPEIRASVRRNFAKVVDCGTPALGAEVYASALEQRVVNHTCKSRSCPSCGQVANIDWQRRRWAALPDVPFAGIVFTMPDVLWPIYKRNRHLLHDLPALAGAVIQQWAAATYGVEIMGLVVTHTFGGKLNFHPHLHMLVSAAGWHKREGRWIPKVAFDGPALMRRWRYAVVAHLRQAMRAGCLETEMAADVFWPMLSTQYGRTWKVYVGGLTSKAHFLRYAGRYLRRPPLAQHRILELRPDGVKVLLKDTRLKQRVTRDFTNEELIQTLSEHVPEHYRHGVRYFGLLAPRSKGKRMAGLFALLGQRQRPSPRRLSFSYLSKREFGIDPLVDLKGNRMRLIARRPPLRSNSI